MVYIDDIKELKHKIRNKLRDYKRRDKILKLKFPKENENLNTINMNEAIELVNKLDNIYCIGCNCKLLFCNYNKWCLFQFTYDRINNNLIHSIDNLRIVCLNCNCIGFGTKKNNCLYCNH